MSTTMRAKLEISGVVRHGADCETLTFRGVAKSDGYPADGSDEDNTFAKFSPSVHLEICITNPALIGKFNAGEKYYVDFTPAK